MSTVTQPVLRRVMERLAESWRGELWLGSARLGPGIAWHVRARHWWGGVRRGTDAAWRGNDVEGQGQARTGMVRYGQ